ncbi:MAG TPA: NAD(P)H-dependent oxidoreductase [Solirubrobacteraceae bacterium]|jgi:chromate reductase|nr:NAD(P)H-dependent oxidoreductase [Solirubrobacteraceae bacterium]
MRILGIAGSLRRDSHNRRLLRAAARLLPPDVELVELDPQAIKSLPHFDEDDEDLEIPAVEAWRDALREADGALFVTPEYNGSVPGSLKNAVDWASRPFSDPALRNLPVAVIGASTGMFGAVWAQGDLRRALGLAGARVVDRELPVPEVHETLHPEHGLGDEDIERELAGILADLVEAIRARRAARV